MLEIFLGCFTFSTKDEKIKVIRDSSNLLVFIQVFHIEEYCLFKLSIHLFYLASCNRFDYSRYKSIYLDRYKYDNTCADLRAEPPIFLQCYQLRLLSFIG